jgi:hypothetical protein
MFDGDTVVCDSGRCADLYTDNGREEIPCPPFLDRAGDLLKLYEAVTQNRPVSTDGKWGKATLEVVFAILQLSLDRREIALSHQVPLETAA